MQNINEYRKKIKIGEYRHFKGNLYEVVDLAYDSEDMRVLVVYRALYGAHELWVRDADMWCEYVEHDGKKVPRFEYLTKN